jgi:hypothetical protein
MGPMSISALHCKAGGEPEDVAVGEGIISPVGRRIGRNVALAVPPLHAQLSAYRSEIPHLKKCTELAEQPIPREDLGQDRW